MLKLHLTRADDYEGVYLQLSATPAEIGEVWSWLDEISTDASSTRIKGAISDVCSKQIWITLYDSFSKNLCL